MEVVLATALGVSIIFGILWLIDTVDIELLFGLIILGVVGFILGSILLEIFNVIDFGWF